MTEERNRYSISLKPRHDLEAVIDREYHSAPTMKYYRGPVFEFTIMSNRRPILEIAEAPSFSYKPSELMEMLQDANEAEELRQLVAELKSEIRELHEQTSDAHEFYERDT